MNVLVWIILSTFAMSLIALIGLITFTLKEETLKKILLILVAFAAGSLMGGAFLHLLPESIAKGGPQPDIFLWLLSGFSIFFLIERFLQWHHCHVVPSEHKKPVTYMILLADGLHNFIGGLSIAGSFIVSVEVGMITWLACAAHEIPQELGDFGILIYGGWEKKKALLFNFISAFTIVLGGVMAYLVSFRFDTAFLLPFAAGNFIYIAASDLIPEIKSDESLLKSLTHFFTFVFGILLILVIRIIFE